MLFNAIGGGWVSAFLEKSVTEVYGSTLLALRGGGWGSNSQPGKKRYDTFSHLSTVESLLYDHHQIHIGVFVRGMVAREGFI